ncbi:MAG: DUF4956 domain-containing protein [Clostridiales bacterium]|mgnify:FL=1|nr:DUF4956 domain-containing protein [Clostridiales bacterium]
MFDTIFTGTMSPSDLSINAISVLISIAVALLLGLVVSLTYLVSTTRHQRSSSFVLSLIILPSLVAVVIILIGGNIARAFTTAGIFTLIRFRSVPGDSKDLSYIFLSMAVGLSLGLGYLTLAAVIALIICVVMLVANKLFISKSRHKVKRLKITIPEDLNYEGIFDEVFAKYTVHHELNRIRTTNMGTMLELQYDIMPKRGMSEKEFIDELRLRNGNLTIQLGVNEAVAQQL